MFQIWGGNVLQQRASSRPFPPAEMQTWTASSIYRKDDENVWGILGLWNTLMNRTWPVTWVIQFATVAWDGSTLLVHPVPMLLAHLFQAQALPEGFCCFPWLPSFWECSFHLPALSWYRHLCTTTLSLSGSLPPHHTHRIVVSMPNSPNVLLFTAE